MKSFITQLIIFLLLNLIYISCKEESTSSNLETNNNPPEIVEFLFAPQTPLDLSIHDRIEVQVIAIDLDDDHLTYFWECSGEIESPIGAPDNLIVMLANSTGNYILRAYVSDRITTTVDTVLIEVVDNSIILPESNLNFTDHIQPLFRLRCGSENGCHAYNNTGGPPARGLEMINYQALIAHSIDGNEPLIVPGEAEQSFLYNILLGPQSGRPQMPKDRKPLNTNNLNGIKTWIDEGALQ
jgi:hypothetical protein